MPKNTVIKLQKFKLEKQVNIIFGSLLPSECWLEGSRFVRNQRITTFI